MLALAFATAILFVSGAEQVQFESIDTARFDGALEQTVSASDQAISVLLDAPLARARDLLVVADDAGNRTLYALARSRVSALAPHPANVQRDAALVTLDGMGGEERLGFEVYSVLDRDAAATRGKALLSIPETADRLRLRYVVLAHAGSHRFESDPVRIVAHRAGYPALMALIALCWATLFALLILRIVRRVGLIATLLCTGALAIIVVGVGLSESAPWHGRDALVDAIGRLLPSGDEFGPNVVFKGGHFLAFLCAGLVTAAWRERLSVTRGEALLFLVLIACASEALQRHLIDRNANLTDVVIDACGALLGYTVIRTGLHALRRYHP